MKTAEDLLLLTAEALLVELPWEELAERYKFSRRAAFRFRKRIREQCQNGAQTVPEECQNGARTVRIVSIGAEVCISCIGSKSNTNPPNPPDGGKPRKARRGGVKVSMPEDFGLRPEDRTFAADFCRKLSVPIGSVDPDIVLDEIRDWATSKGELKVDWYATWRNAYRRAVKDWKARQRVNQGPAPGALEHAERKRRAEAYDRQIQQLTAIGAVGKAVP